MLITPSSHSSPQAARSSLRPLSGETLAHPGHIQGTFRALASSLACLWCMYNDGSGPYSPSQPPTSGSKAAPAGAEVHTAGRGCMFPGRLSKSTVLSRPPEVPIQCSEPRPGAGAPDVLMAVHVHGVELLLVLLALVLLHVLQHLVGHVLGQDGEHKVLLWGRRG